MTAHSWTYKMILQRHTKWQVHTKWRNLGQIQFILNFIAVSEHAASSTFSLNFLVFPFIPTLSLSLPLFLSLFVSLSLIYIIR